MWKKTLSKKLVSNKAIAYCFIFIYIFSIFVFSLLYWIIYDQFYYSSLKNEPYSTRLKDKITYNVGINLKNFYLRGSESISDKKLESDLELLNEEYQKLLNSGNRDLIEKKINTTVHFGTFFKDISVSDFIVSNKVTEFDYTIYYFDYYFTYTDKYVTKSIDLLIQKASISKNYEYSSNTYQQEPIWVVKHIDSIENEYFPREIPNDVLEANYFGIFETNSDYLKKYEDLVLYSKDYDTGFNRYMRTLYLSMITITTLGFGDIVPLTTLSRTLIGVEAVLGIFIPGLFFAVLFRKIGDIN